LRKAELIEALNKALEHLSKAEAEVKNSLVALKKFKKYASSYTFIESALRSLLSAVEEVKADVDYWSEEAFIEEAG